MRPPGEETHFGFQIGNFITINAAGPCANTIVSNLLGNVFVTRVVMKREQRRRKLYMAVRIRCLEPDVFDADWMTPLGVSLFLKKAPDLEHVQLIKQDFFFDSSNMIIESGFTESTLHSNLVPFLINGQLGVYVSLIANAPIGILNYFSANMEVYIDGEPIPVNKNLLIANSAIFEDIFTKLGNCHQNELEFSQFFFRLPTMDSVFLDELASMDLNQAFRDAYRLISKTDYFADYTDVNVSAILLIARQFRFVNVEKSSIYYIIRCSGLGFVRKFNIFHNLGYELWKNYVVRSASVEETTMQRNLFAGNLRATRKLTTSELEEAMKQGALASTSKKPKMG